MTPRKCFSCYFLLAPTRHAEPRPSACTAGRVPTAATATQLEGTGRGTCTRPDTAEAKHSCLFFPSFPCCAQGLRLSQLPLEKRAGHKTGQIASLLQGRKERQIIFQVTCVNDIQPALILSANLRSKILTVICVLE